MKNIKLIQQNEEYSRNSDEKSHKEYQFTIKK